jgi:two-component system chemotaxis response regulator CheY
MNKSKLLLVNSAPNMKKIISGMLKELGYENLDEVNDFSEALTILKDNVVDLLILGANINESQSLSFLNSIRQEIMYKKIPVIMMSTEARREQIVEAASLGAAHYLVMPINQQVLGEKIDKILKNKVK